MSLKHTKLNDKISKLNTIIDFVEINVIDEVLRERYIKVLRHQKALIRDIDRKGRKIPENTPYVCEITGCEVNSIREKEPAFKLEENIHLGYNNMLLSDMIKSDIPHNSYEHLLNNVSLKGVKKLLGRKIVFDDLKNIEDNIILIVEVFKHQDYYKKYVDIKSFAMKVNEVEEYIGGLV